VLPAVPVPAVVFEGKHHRKGKDPLPGSTPYGTPSYAEYGDDAVPEHVVHDAYTSSFDGVVVMDRPSFESFSRSSVVRHCVRFSCTDVSFTCSDRLDARRCSGHAASAQSRPGMHSVTPETVGVRP